jgi:hypothetical protein
MTVPAPGPGQTSNQTVNRSVIELGLCESANPRPAKKLGREEKSGY